MSSNPFSPLPGSSQAGATSSGPQPSASNSNPSERPKAKKRKGHRGGKKKRSRRKSFAVLDDDHDEGSQASGDAFYKDPARNLSDTSLDSQALLDHRSHQALRPRRASTAPAPASPFQSSSFTGGPSTSRLRSMQTIVSVGDTDEHDQWDEGASLLGDSRQPGSGTGLSGYGTNEGRGARSLSRKTSNKTSPTRLGTSSGTREQYDVNNPPSVPGSPRFGTSDNFGDAMLRDELSLHDASPGASVANDDHLSRAGLERRMTAIAEKDVCFPGPGMSELGEDESHSVTHETRQSRPRRRRDPWPDLSALEEWSHMEKEGRTEERRVKRVTEPQLINGRLRPVRKGWSQAVEESPYRFTYFNEELQSTIHSQTISELIQPGGSFRELFIPDRPILSDDDSDEEVDPLSDPAKFHHLGSGADGESKMSTRQPSMAASRENLELRHEGASSPAKDPATASSSRSESGRATPSGQKSSEDSVKPTQTTDTVVEPQEKTVRYGDRPVWWLDVLCPTDDEMMVLSKAFGIHPLTGEDILMKDPREKVELFRHYYFVNYRTFNQDSNSETFLEPVDMYVLVFREGVLSFHFALTPHAANVRRRIRQLQDYVFVSSDWISYAIIDDITDAFQPLIKNIENEVDDIDDEILMLHSSADKRLKDDKLDSTADDASDVGGSRGDMLQRVGDCRKRVMNLYRLLGNKADVIKGFAKRCNERWEVAPRSEIGLYLGDIQDHIVTMTSNLSHYEGILARSHANYLAQINIRMNERQEQTADVLGKLTVLGTIVLPMNIITGLWGMNVWVPGQEYEGDLTWFAWITAGLVFFGLACYMIAKRVYNIV